MPKERRSRISSTHEPSVKLHKRTYAVQDNAVEHVEIGAKTEASGNEILADIDGSKGPHEMSMKKEKQALKQESFLQKLSAIKAPYSKSHARREKRKAKEQLAGGGLTDIQAILSTITSDDTHNDNQYDHDSAKNANPTEPDQSGSNPRKQGMIGGGKQVPLSKNQRKRILKMEQFRQPLIRSNPEFAKHPFQTIRTHAQNTLIKHQAPSS